MKFSQVDVFSRTAYCGNSLAVFLDAGALSARQRLAITNELRHFETVFLEPTPEPTTWRAHVVALDGELPFAGHPLLGAAAVLHENAADRNENEKQWIFLLPSRSIRVNTSTAVSSIRCTLILQAPEWGSFLTNQQVKLLLAALSLKSEHRHPHLVPQVVDVGLRYLVVPVSSGIENACIRVNDLTERLGAVGADFVYLIQVDAAKTKLAVEARHWTNDGRFEDVATGSGAAAAAAYLGMQGLLETGQRYVLNQGRFTGRPSEIDISVTIQGANVTGITVGGSVVAVAQGYLIRLPEGNA